MRRQTFENGWYGEALPSGHFAVTMVGQNAVLTHAGLWPLPGDNLLFTRCSDAGGFRVAGQSHIGRGNMLSIGSDFYTIGGSYGVSPVLFTPTGEVVQNEPKYGSQGFRYWDGRPVTGDETYVHPTYPQLWEYTTLGDVTVGQGESGAIVYYQGKRRLLEPGNTRFIRFNRDGDNLAFAIVMPGYCLLIWMTVQELAQLPEVAIMTAPPPPAPDPPPVPGPEPMSLQAPNEIETVRRVMREHPEINTRDENARGNILPYICAALGGKPWGRKSRNAQGTDLNTDALTFLRADGLFEIYDVISGADGGATWDGFGPFRQGENGYWVEAQPVSGPPPTPDPPPPSDDLAKLRAQVEAMNEAILYNFQTMTIRFDQLKARVEALEQKPAGTLPKLRVKGDTAPAGYRFLSHSHKVALEVVPE